MYVPLRTLTNKPVETTVHYRLKFYFDPNDRPIAPPTNDVPDEPYLQLEDIPNDSFEQKETESVASNNNNHNYSHATKDKL